MVLFKMQKELRYALTASVGFCYQPACCKDVLLFPLPYFLHLFKFPSLKFLPWVSFIQSSLGAIARRPTRRMGWYVELSRLRTLYSLGINQHCSIFLVHFLEEPQKQRCNTRYALLDHRAPSPSCMSPNPLESVCGLFLSLRGISF